MDQLAAFVEWADTDGGMVIHELARHVKKGTSEWNQLVAFGERLYGVAWKMSKAPSDHMQTLGALARGCISAALTRLDYEELDLPLTRWMSLAPDANHALQRAREAASLA